MFERDLMGEDCKRCDGTGLCLVQNKMHGGKFTAFAVMRCTCVYGKQLPSPRLSETHARR